MPEEQRSRNKKDTVGMGAEIEGGSEEEAAPTGKDNIFSEEACEHKQDLRR
jgi:hypothetical protein